jgi:hypothetical protein
VTNRTRTTPGTDDPTPTRRKKFSTTTKNVGLAASLLSPPASVGGETNPTYATIMAAAASNDVHGVLHTLPEMDKLRSQEPVLYFRATQRVAPLLGGVATNAVVRQALWALFDQLLATPCPTNNEQAAACFGLKDKTISWFFNFPEVRHDRARLVQVAGFLGEIRSRRIPNYQNRRAGGGVGRDILIRAGVMSHNQITNPVLQQAYAKAVEDDEQAFIMDQLQRELFMADTGLSFSIMHKCSYLLDKKRSHFVANDQQNMDFIEQLVTAAHLTDDERNKLMAKMK